MKINIKNYLLPELEELFISFGEKRFRARQIFQWLYKGIYDYEYMTDISKDLKNVLIENTYIENISCKKIMVSHEDETKKYLFRLSDGNIIESVYMKYKHGNSVCVSSQAGCRMGCSFCASTIGGLQRNLLASEMIDQVLKIQSDTGEKISNVVIMGSGEPFENYDEVLRFIRILHTKEGLNMSLRNITVSTCGIIPNIIDFAYQMPQVTLAVSLHASNDETRNRIMPINKKYPLPQLMKACKEYIAITNKRITFEYALIEGVNDSEKDAKELALLVKDMLCHVNLISLNKVDESHLKGTNRQTAERFKNILEQYKINATIRRELGSDIDAACGQLRRRYNNRKN